MTATTTTGVPIYRSKAWHNALNPDTDTIARALTTQAYSRVIEPTIYRAAYQTLDALHGHVMAHLPAAEHQRARTLFRITDNLVGSLAMGVIALTTDLLRAARGTFDPLDTLEANLQRAFATMGITNAGQAAAYGIAEMSAYLPEFRAQFPDVTLGVTDDDADDDGEGGAACNS
jgi:phage tail protein X